MATDGVCVGCVLRARASSTHLLCFRATPPTHPVQFPFSLLPLLQLLHILCDFAILAQGQKYCPIAIALAPFRWLPSRLTLYWGLSAGTDLPTFLPDLPLGCVGG